MTQPIRWLQDEIADRMLQKLDIVKLDVKDILIVPDFPGKHLDVFAKRYPRARLISLVDESVSGFAMWRAKAVTHWRSLFGARTSSLASYTSSGRFDVPDNSVDLIFLLSAAHEIRSQSEKIEFLKECHRVCKSTSRVIMVEHLRDFPNFVAFTIGFTHFFSKNIWKKSIFRSWFFRV